MFLAHKSLLSNTEYHVLNQYDRKKVLVNNEGSFHLVSNICTHQHSIISVEHGKGNRVCPYHNWSFNISGIPVSSGRTEYYCKNTTPLSNEPVYEWNSLLFSVPVDFKIDTDFTNMKLMESRIDKVKTNHKNIMDLFLDVDHIPTVHRGVYDRIGIRDTNVEWKHYENGSVQTVQQGALWIAVYPYTMIEWQKGALFVTTALPAANNESIVYVHKYCDPSYMNDWTLNEDVWETAWYQDRQQAELITTTAQRNLEPQKIHFREYMKRNGIN